MLSAQTFVIDKDVLGAITVEVENFNALHIVEGPTRIVFFTRIPNLEG
jgi:hypothetical protein